MTPYFEFVSSSASGSTVRGRVESSAGSLVNRAQLWLDRNWDGDIQPKDSIEIALVAVGALGDAFALNLFIGVVSLVRPAGDFILVEAVTSGAQLLLKQAPVLGWSNATLSRVLKDLFSAGGISSTSTWWPAAFDQVFLHSWNTDAGLLAHEITELLVANAPGSVASAMPDDTISIGSREELARQLSVFTFPTDASLPAAGLPEANRTRFSPRPVYAGQAVQDPFDSSFMGTVDSVVHVLRPGQAYSEILLDRTDDVGVAGYVAEGVSTTSLPPAGSPEG